MFRWAFGLVVAVTVMVGGMAPETASAAHGKGGSRSGQVSKGKKGHKRGGHGKGARKGGHRKGGHKKHS
jgi:hypothetical protein